MTILYITCYDAYIVQLMILQSCLLLDSQKIILNYFSLDIIS